MIELARLFQLQPSSAPGDTASEFVQWRLRFIFALLVIVGGVLVVFVDDSGNQPEAWLKSLWLACAIYIAAGLVLHQSAKAHPGHYPARRIAAILLDASALTFGIMLNPWVTLPLYAALVGIVSGNGLRYGRAYLIFGAGVVQIALLIIYFLGPFTNVQPHVAIMMSLTAIVLPGHAYLMLQKVESARKTAEDASRSKSQFLAQASHDLRQPLHASKLLIGSLREKAMPADQLAIVDRIDRSLGGVSNLFKSLLDVSMLDSGKLTPRVERIELNDFIQSIVSEISLAADWADCRIRTVRTNKVVISDRTLLKSMVQNLLSNAIKYSDGRDILVGPRRRGRTLGIEVWDQGPGIAAKEQASVFEEFYQVRNIGDKDRAGVGLGLSIVRRLADMLHLDVEMSSREGKGTCVGIYGLHLSRRIDVPVTRANSTNQSTALMPMRGYRVLLIEDDADCRDATESLLRNWGCHVSSWDRVPPLVQPEFDLLLTDFDLGDGLTGADAIRKYRDALGPKAPVLMLTGHDRALYERMAINGDVMILKKPFAPAELRSLLNSIRLGLRHPIGDVIE